MNSARTLADRFRTQRTEQIRVDGIEVRSVIDLDISSDEVAEIVVEHCRTDVEQALSMRTSPGLLCVTDADDMPIELDVELVALSISEPMRADVRSSDSTAHTLQLWNSWVVGGCTHSWTGNSGIVVEELDTPPGASQRLRLWCSDGLGDPEFDDLVVVVTVGPAAEDD